MKMTQSNAYDLRKLGYSKELAEGVVAALKHYGTIDVSKYLTVLQESLQYLTPGREELPDLQTDKKLDEPAEEKKVVEKTVAVEEETDDKNFQDIEDTVLETIKEVEGDDGASWDAITKKCEKAGLDKDSIEEALTSLMDKGLIYEPILGTIKTT